VKRSKFTEEQIAFALKQAEVGTSVEEVCLKMGISDATFYNWRKKYGGLGPSDLRRLRQLEEENSKLKRLVADLSLDKAMLQDVLAKNSEAFPQAHTGDQFDAALWRESNAGVRHAADVTVCLQLPVMVDRPHHRRFVGLDFLSFPSTRCSSSTFGAKTIADGQER
jgi:putative transposase